MNLRLCAALAATLLLTTPASARADGTIGQPLYKSGDIFVQYLGSDAAFASVMFMWVGPEIPFDDFLFNNYGTPLGTVVDVQDTNLPIGAELLFTLCVTTTPGEGATCPAATYQVSNGMVGGGVWMKVWTAADYSTEIGLDLTGYEYVVGFEDMTQGSDFDYNDAVFAIRGVSTVPEPLTVTLVATGLVGIGAIRRQRAAARAGRRTGWRRS